MNLLKDNNPGCFTALIGATIFLVFKSTILMLFWQWFITPVFGLIPISFLQSLGLMVIIDFLRFKKEKKESVPTWVFIIDVVMNLLILLTLVFLIHLIV
jgi:hypothetical protein